MLSSSRETILILFSIPFYGVLILSEVILSNWKAQKIYTWKDTLQNVVLTCLNGGLDIILRSLFYVAVLLWCYQHKIFTLQNGWIYWIALFFIEDFMFYIQHLLDHYTRFLWAVHVTHHSSEEFNLTTGFRSSVFQPVYRFIYFIPVVLIGFHPIDIIFMYSLTQTYGIIVHTQYVKKFPAFIEAIFVTPSHHRVHHASNVRYLDKNMGMCLIIWDKLFGTFQKELNEDPVKFGLNKNTNSSSNIFNIVFDEWVNIGGDLKKKLPFKTRLKYLFMPPGWSHDGSTKTSGELRNELAQNIKP